MPIHLYMTLYPNNALIGSQLPPDQFARHYTSGSGRHYSGKVVFAEINPEYRHSYFPIDEVSKEIVPHEDGRPKATKFISSYRVLEHIEFSAIQNLYLVTPSGESLELKSAELKAEHEPNKIRLYAEITPMRMTALSRDDFPSFGKRITIPNEPKSAPVQFYTQLEIDLPGFVKELEEKPFTPSPILNIHPCILRNGYEELVKDPSKINKGITLDSNLDQFSYKIIRHGFMFASQKETKFFPMLDDNEIQIKNFRFWKNM